MTIIGKTFKFVLWSVFGLVWLIFGMGPPAIAFIGYAAGSNVPLSSLFLMALYAMAMMLLGVLAVAWVNDTPST